MRFIRMASLLAGAVLVLSGIADVVGRRAELAEDRDRTLETSAQVTAARTDAAIARIAAVLAVAPPDATPAALARALGVVACAGDATCSSPDGDDVGAPAGSDAAAARATTASRAGDGAAVAVGGDPTEPVVVVALSRDDGTRWAVASMDDLSSRPADGIPRRLVAAGEGSPGSSAVTVDDERIASAGLVTAFVDGPQRVEAVGDPTISLGADGRTLAAAQLLIGGALVALAAGNLVAEHRTLRRRATIDHLTGLPNRAEFHHQATEALARARRNGTPACVMLVDLDRFKAINDSAGHHVGDQVLAAAAHRLRGAVRASDLVGRWGGDEFVAFLDGVGDADAVAARARAIELALAEPAAGVAAPDVQIAASVGAALFPRHGADVDELVRAADTAMYAARSAGERHRLAVP